MPTPQRGTKSLLRAPFDGIGCGALSDCVPLPGATSRIHRSDFSGRGQIPALSSNRRHYANWSWSTQYSSDMPGSAGNCWCCPVSASAAMHSRALCEGRVSSEDKGLRAEPPTEPGRPTGGTDLYYAIRTRHKAEVASTQVGNSSVKIVSDRADR